MNDGQELFFWRWGIKLMNKTNPKVSIILTSYNHAKYLRDCIDSVLCQTFSDFELIIWDDVSTDNSWDVICQYLDQRIKTFRNQENMRTPFGMNKAISEIARGQYIAIHHSDDVWEPTKLAKQVAFLDSHPDIGAVFTWVDVIGENGEPLSAGSHYYQTCFNTANRTRQKWLNALFYGNTLCHPTVLIRRHCYEQCGPYRYGLTQLADHDMWIRLCLKYEIHVLQEKLVRFRVRDNEANTSGIRRDTQLRSITEFYFLLQNYLKISSFEELVLVFPESQEYYCSDDTLVPFGLARVFLSEKLSPWAHLFGLNILYDMMRQDDLREKLRHRYGFGINDLNALAGQYDVFSYRRISDLRERIARRDMVIRELEQKLSGHQCE